VRRQRAARGGRDEASHPHGLPNPNGARFLQGYVLARHRKNPAEQHDRHTGADTLADSIRIVGGQFRGRKLLYTGDLRTRPMKDRVREAVFNLIGTDAAGKHAIDLFAGTGALGLEAMSRGATRATFFEQHYPTARVVRQNAALLGVADRAAVESGNVFLWAPQAEIETDQPWLVFCSPPYSFYVDRLGEVLALINALIDRAPQGSVFVVESDAKFDIARLPPTLEWDVRQYLPAVIAIGRKA
jgi:16S rRNA (guanine(966)-N(2))-methyltransferase RsmD